MLQPGDLTPLDIVVSQQDGSNFSLELSLGRKVIVYFYPKDDTPGCTTEACGIRDAWQEFRDLNIDVFGVSKDGEKSHQKFIDKFQLPFNLLCDTEHKLAHAFGAWGEKKMYGKSYMGMLRSTFIIDEKGFILKTYPKVTPAKHTKELLQYLSSL